MPRAIHIGVDEFVSAPPRIVEYDPCWPHAFATEAAAVSAALVGVPHRVEHIGSTAVPGLPAKPVVDIMVGVADYVRFERIRDRLAGLGYVWDVFAERSDPRRKVFRKGPADPTLMRTHHLHLTVEQGEYWRRVLAFRDELRGNPAATAEYLQVKYRMLRECSGDSRAYTAGKHDVVKRIERQAGVHVP